MMKVTHQTLSKWSTHFKTLVARFGISESFEATHKHLTIQRNKHLIHFFYSRYHICKMLHYCPANTLIICKRNDYKY